MRLFSFCCFEFWFYLYFVYSDFSLRCSSSAPVLRFVTWVCLQKWRESVVCLLFSDASADELTVHGVHGAPLGPVHPMGGVASMISSVVSHTAHITAATTVTGGAKQPRSTFGKRNIKSQVIKAFYETENLCNEPIKAYINWLLLEGFLASLYLDEKLFFQYFPGLQYLLCAFSRSKIHSPASGSSV